MQMYNEDLNKLEMKIKEGDFAGYSVSFDLQFIAGGNMVETMNASSEDLYEGYHIGNTFARWDETFRGFSPRETATGERVEIGGLTSENKSFLKTRKSILPPPQQKVRLQISISCQACYCLDSCFLPLCHLLLLYLYHQCSVHQAQITSHIILYIRKDYFIP